MKPSDADGSGTRACPGVMLEGLRATGKSTLGRLVASALGCEFIDLDDVAARRAGFANAGAALRALGESAWRQAELEALTETLSQREPELEKSAELGSPTQTGARVIALGGGTPSDSRCYELLAQARKGGWVVGLLECEHALLLERMAQGETDRPALTPLDPVSEVKQLAAAREPAYLRLADFRLDVTRLDAAGATGALLAMLGSFGMRPQA